MLATTAAWAQERTVSGRVTSAEDGTGVPGVNVVVKGTTSGTVTDSDGNYRLTVSGSSSILVFSFIGLATQEVEVGDRTTVDMQMTADIQQLNEVVVTALGVERSVKSLPYATQSITGERLNITRPNNINEGLAGKVAGIQVRGQSGAALGRNSTIRVRGAGSLNDKAPLYIVDGTPMNSSDINPDDVESMQVLKGPNATALYGQRGDAGVIVVTLKKGTKQKGIGIDVSQNLFLDNVYVLPKYQNSYAGGAFADLTKFTWQDGMPAEWAPLSGKYFHDYTDDGSWGPRMVGQDYIPWYAWIPGTKYTGKTAKLVAQPGNIRNFYETGINRVNNISFSKADEINSIRVSFTNQGQTGIMPNTSLKKNTLALSASSKLNKILTVGANINYVNQLTNGEFDDAYSNATSGSFNQWFHRNIDMNILKELAFVKSPEGRLVSWNHFNPSTYLTSGDKFYRGYYWYNPYAYMKLIDYNTTNNRLFGDINLALKLNDNLTVKAWYRKNQISQFSENKRPSILPYSFYTELRETSQPQYDYYGTSQVFSREDNMEVLATYTNNFLDEKLSVILNAGGNLRKEEYKDISGGTINGLVVPDLYTLSNSKTQPFSSGNFRSRKEVQSVYAFGSFGYNETFFIDWSARNDWSSALPTNANSYFYPSVGTSFVFSEFTENALPFLSFGKLRASWAQVGSDLSAYQLSLLYGVQTAQWNSNILTGTPDELVDAGIKPSLSSSYETGLDLKFFHDRVGLNLTYYNETKRNEIISVPVSGTSGFNSKKINAGELNRSGLEIALTAKPIVSSDFNWEVTVNYAKILNNKIVKLSEGVPAVPQGSNDAFNTAGVYNVAGEQWGQIRGFGITKNDAGVPVLDESGFYVPTQNQYLGSVLPNFTGGIINNLSYKRFSAAVNIDFQSGGKFFSLSDWFGTFSGLTQRTADLNDKGIPVRDAVVDGGGVRVDGVDQETGEAVTRYVEGKLYYQQFVNNSIASNSLFDLTYVKLREVSLGYTIPVDKFGIGRVIRSATISVVGRNLWLIHTKARDFDPSEISNTFGENGQFPGLRSYGFNLKLSL